MNRFLDQWFQVSARGSSIRTEMLAGLVSFLAGVYIVVVNAAILTDAGIPMAAGIVATAVTACLGSLMMGLWAGSPLIILPGMGLNALFTYTVVQGMGLRWQEALAAVTLSGVIFCVVAFTRLSRVLSAAIPQAMKDAMTVGIGVFLTFIGLQKGGLVVPSHTTFVAMGDLASPQVLVTLATLAIAVVLFVRQVQGSFLIAMAAGAAMAWGAGLIVTPQAAESSLNMSQFTAVAGALSFAKLGSLGFWVAVFSFAMVVVFENMGILQGMLPDKEQMPRALQATALSMALAGAVGTSPTVAAVEGAAGVAVGGRTGLTAVTGGLLLLSTLFMIPVIRLVPDSAIAPVLVIIGCLMMSHVSNIPFHDLSEGFPAFLMIVLIPLTYSISDGMAFGFIAYPLVKLAMGKRQEIPMPLYLISGLFLLNFVLHAAA